MILSLESNLTTITLQPEFFSQVHEQPQEWKKIDPMKIETTNRHVLRRIGDLVEEPVVFIHSVKLL